MKIIFLDHQGVMYTRKHPNPGKLDDFDMKTVKELNSILELDSSIELVVSSDWKYWVDFEEMCRFYVKQGLKAPIAYTPKTLNYTYSIYNQQRAKEIKAWLNNNQDLNITHWVAIDDMDMRDHLDNFVWINQVQDGITQSGAKELLLQHLINSSSANPADSSQDARRRSPHRS